MHIKFPQMSEEQRLRRLQLPSGKVNMVLDTDAFNEIDDQFAIAYAMMSKSSLNLQAIYAAPFYNSLSEGPKDGMEKSYEEMIRILDKMDESAEGFVFRGSESYLPASDQPVDSPAARDLVARALAAPDNEPLYVAAIGAVTNVASAIIMEPKIIEKIVVVWLGGHHLNWPDTKEFNLKQDVYAARILFDSGVPLVLIPCMGVASHLLTTLPEIERYVKGKGKIGDFLAQRYEECSSDHFGYSRVIWDLAAIAWLINPDFVPAPLIHSPVLTEDVTWSQDSSRHFIRCAHFVKRDAIFKDFFNKLRDRAEK